MPEIIVTTGGGCASGERLRQLLNKLRLPDHPDFVILTRQEAASILDLLDASLDFSGSHVDPDPEEALSALSDLADMLKVSVEWGVRRQELLDLIRGSNSNGQGKP